MNHCTAVYNGTCAELLPKPRKAVQGEDLDSTSCVFPCKKCGVNRHTLNQHLVRRYEAYLLHPYAPLLDFAYGEASQLIMSLEQVWVEVSKIRVWNKALTWRQLEDVYPHEETPRSH
ncbi:hypothetical protein Y032_0036g3226 [Ancylostoma ceylanicum]|uniref:Uncharacterized protein n=1 Tax=Ancylostoma ceylanicum TaxID=53326 RepID=A0A016UL19_9BILA|nr:hypothetical protein Y032_0036g3226 [Ancylostoma ceylanicum]